jgi:hypothetical protein
VSVVYVDAKSGAPRFRLAIGNDRMETLHECKLQHAGVCDALGVRLSFAPASDRKDAIILSFQGAASDRTIGMTNSSNPLKP